MIIETGRFGQLAIGQENKITIPQGILGIPESKEYCLFDQGDETLILWLQSIDGDEIAFPIIESKIILPDYRVNLSALELRELNLTSLENIAVFSILTIPDDITQMTANLKAPIVVNLKEQIAKQVVLQENNYSIKHLMFKTLRQHLMTIQSQDQSGQSVTKGPVVVKAIPPTRGMVVSMRSL